MVWDDVDAPAVGGRDEPIELVGTHLRLTGTVSLGRFNRLTDMVNANAGYLRVRDARLLRRNGEPTSLVLAEIMVDQDEISFIAQSEVQAPNGSTGGFDPGFSEPGLERTARPFVMFTPGHTLSGRVHLFGQTDLAAFVDSSDPRFVPVVEVSTRSLADRRIVGHYPFVLINRTQMIAAAEAGIADGPEPDALGDEGMPAEAVAEP